MFARIAELGITVGTQDPAGQRMTALRFDENAQEHFNEWRSNLENRLRSGVGHSALESYLAKFRSLVPSISLICHLVDKGEGPVSEEAVLRACSWADFLETHARRIYAWGSVGGKDPAAVLLEHIRAGDLSNPFVSGVVIRKKWSGLRDTDTVHQALDVLQTHGYIRARRVTTSGRPRVDYHVHPNWVPREGSPEPEEEAA